MREELSPQELGARLQEARKTRGLTQQEAADALGVARTTLVAIESGQRQVQPHELIKIAELYGKEVSDLKRSASPAESFSVQFRAVLKRDTDSNLARLISVFKEFCDHYLFLEKLCGVKREVTTAPQYAVKGISWERAGESAARAERNRLGLGDGPIADLRGLLEDEVGLRVFYLDMPGNVSGLFAFTQEHGGCIAVNRKHPLERNRWSLAHEYGHFLTNRFSADVVLIEDTRPLSGPERVADSLARNFLLPAETVHRRFDSLLQQQGKRVTPADLIEMSSYFGVSFKALCLRLEELKRLPHGTWTGLVSRGFRVEEAKALVNAPKLNERTEQFPRRYLLLAVKAYAAGELSEGLLAQMLNVDRLDAREAISTVLRELGVDDLEMLNLSLPE